MRAVLAVLAGLAASAAAAPAQAATSISIYSDPNDWIGQGTPHVFHAGNTVGMGAHMYEGRIVAWANGTGEDGSFSFEFAAPHGQPLEPRSYIGAQRLPFRESGRPGMELFGGSRGCNAVSGRFELRDLVTNAAGDIVRLWLFYEHHCEGSPRAAWGEIRVGAPAQAGTDATAPGRVRWPPLDSWRTATPAPVLYRGGSPIASATLAGEGAANFELDASGCVGRAGPCAVVARYEPVVAGAREATLRLTDAGGAVHETALEGFTYGGTTSATVEVLPGDVASEPGTYTYGPSNAIFGGQAYDPETNFFVAGNDGRYFNGRFGAGGGTPLSPGSYAPADSYFSSRPWLFVQGTELFCNASGGDFTVHEISRLPDGNLHTFDVSFEQDCYEDHRAAHRGRLRYRAGATAPLPDWMFSGPRPVIPPPAGTEQPEAGTGGAVTSSGSSAATPAATGPAATGPAATGPAVRPRVSARWRVTSAGTRVDRLVVTSPVAASRVQLRCSGRRCPFARRAVPLRAGRADLRPALRRAVLRPGAVLRVRVLRGTTALAQVRYVIRRARAPRAVCPGPSGPPCLR